MLLVHDRALLLLWSHQVPGLKGRCNVRDLIGALSWSQQETPSHKPTPRRLCHTQGSAQLHSFRTFSPPESSTVNTFNQDRNPCGSSRAVKSDTTTQSTIRHPAHKPSIHQFKHRAISHVSRRYFLQTLSAVRQTSGCVGIKVRRAMRGARIIWQ